MVFFVVLEGDERAYADVLRGVVSGLEVSAQAACPVGDVVPQRGIQLPVGVEVHAGEDGLQAHVVLVERERALVVALVQLCVQVACRREAGQECE